MCVVSTYNYVGGSRGCAPPSRSNFLYFQVVFHPTFGVDVPRLGNPESGVVSFTDPLF